MSRVAVLMPTLATAGWDRFIPDLLQQSRPPDRIVVVVDRPTEAREREELAGRWPQIDFVFNARNLGITASLNAGLRAASDAEIIVRADDDDKSMPLRIERQLALLESSGAAFVGSWAEGTSDGSRTYLIQCPVTHQAIADELTRHNCLMHPTLAFRRAAVMALGGYDETFVNAQDYGLYLAGLRSGLRFAAVPEPLVRRHYHSANITVARRMNQLMYSCSARAAHHAATGDRSAFIRTLVQYGILAATPPWARRARRRLFALLGKGR